MKFLRLLLFKIYVTRYYMYTCLEVNKAHVQDFLCILSLSSAPRRRPYACDLVSSDILLWQLISLILNGLQLSALKFHS